MTGHLWEFGEFENTKKTTAFVNDGFKWVWLFRRGDVLVPKKTKLQMAGTSPHRECVTGGS
jgi:hypothetical protein